MQHSPPHPPARFQAAEYHSQHNTRFPFAVNRYNDVVMDADALPTAIIDAEPAEFADYLERTHVRAWRKQGRQGAWFRLPHRMARHLPALLDRGFVAHHTRENYTMLTLWMGGGQGMPCKMPAYGTYAVRVEAVILRGQGVDQEVLMVLERHSRHPDDWKLPSGSVEPGEFVSDAAVREVREELGLDCVFRSILGVANRVRVKWEQNELIFCCLLVLRYGASGSDDGQEPDQQQQQQQQQIRIDKDEIKQARWIRLDDAERYLKARSGAGVLDLQWIRKLLAGIGIQDEGIPQLRETWLRDFRPPPHSMRVFR